jgi:hypothetical protein
MAPIWSGLGSGRARGLASGSTCGGCRSRISCSLRRGTSGYRLSLYWLNPVRLDRFILGSHIFLAGCRCRSDVRRGEPVATAPGTRCQRGPRPESHASLGTLLLRVRVRLFLVFGHGLFSGAAHILDGADWELRCRFAGCSPRGRPTSRPYDSSHSDHSTSYLLCFVVCLLDSHRRLRVYHQLLVKPLRWDGRRRLLVDRLAGCRGDASLRLMSEGTEAATARFTGDPTSENT